MDDPSNENVGWNFLKDGRVSWPVDGRHWLRDHIEADGERQGRFVSTAAVAPRRQARETTRHGATVRLRPKGTGSVPHNSIQLNFVLQLNWIEA